MGCRAGHTAVFSGEHFCTSPPGWAWICTTCGVAGTWTSAERPQLDRIAFAAALLKFHGDDPATRAFAHRLDPFSAGGPSRLS
jgi:hypothetical protein